MFRYIQLPKLRGVLTDRRAAALHGQLHDLHRAVRASPAAGRATPPPSSSQYLRKIAVGQFDLGPAGAFSLLYFLIILLLSFVFYNVHDQSAAEVSAHGRQAAALGADRALTLVLRCCCRIYWMVNMSLKHQRGDPRRLHARARSSRPSTTTRTIFTDPAWYSRLHQLDHLRRR